MPDGIEETNTHFQPERNPLGFDEVHVNLTFKGIEALVAYIEGESQKRNYILVLNPGHAERAFNVQSILPEELVDVESHVHSEGKPDIQRFALVPIMRLLERKFTDDDARNVFWTMLDEQNRQTDRKSILDFIQTFTMNNRPEATQKQIITYRRLGTQVAAVQALLASKELDTISTAEQKQQLQTFFTKNTVEGESGQRVFPSLTDNT